MKKIVFFLFFMIMIAVTVSSQSLGGEWRLQNPPNSNINCVLSFNTAKKTVINSMADMRDQSNVNQTAGNYTFCNGKLLIVMKFIATYKYKVRWINKDKMILDDGHSHLLYARIGSKFDLKKTKH